MRAAPYANVSCFKKKIMFTTDFNLDTPAEHETSILSKVLKSEPWCNVKAGIYNSGLLTICDNANYDFNTLKEWAAHVGDEALPIAFTAWGEVLCISFTNRRFYWLFPQENGASDLGDAADEILNNLLRDEKLSSALLDLERFNNLKENLPSLKYGECYIVKPYQMLGGDEKNPTNYKTGDVGVYLSLVAQTWEQNS